MTYGKIEAVKSHNGYYMTESDFELFPVGSNPPLHVQLDESTEIVITGVDPMFGEDSETAHVMAIIEQVTPNWNYDQPDDYESYIMEYPKIFSYGRAITFVGEVIAAYQNAVKAFNNKHEKWSKKRNADITNEPFFDIEDVLKKLKFRDKTMA